MGRRIFLAGILFLLSLTSALIFIGQKEAGLPAVIPAPDEGIPFLFFEGSGDAFGAMRHPFLADEKKTGSLGRSLDRLLPLLNGAEEVAALFSARLGRIDFDGVARFKDKDSGGWREAPQWAELQPASGETEGPVPGLFKLEGPAPLFPLYFAKAKDLIMIGSSPEKVSLMVEALEKGEGGMAIPWELERKWPNHFYLYDGGIVSRFLSKFWPKVRPGGLSLTGAWRLSDSGGRLRWSAEGGEELFPDHLPGGLEPVGWEGDYLALEPFIASFGINLPPLPAPFIEEEGLNRYGIGEILGLRGRDLEDISGGPLTASLSGRGKLLIFPLPGVLLQLSGRGAAGEAFARSFWRKDWTSLVPGVEKIKGFPAGGVAAIPFSILCAANYRMLRLGIVDGDVFRQKNSQTIADMVPLLKETGRSLFWAYVDGPALGRTITSLLEIDAIAGKIGRGLGINKKTASRVSEELEKMGALTVVIPSLGEGILQWETADNAARGE